ncbi:hypothetical protein ACTXJQ_12185 [Glutamicibacter ardleyensis]
MGAKMKSFQKDNDRPLKRQRIRAQVQIALCVATLAMSGCSAVGSAQEPAKNISPAGMPATVESHQNVQKEASEQVKSMDVSASKASGSTSKSDQTNSKSRPKGTARKVPDQWKKVDDGRKVGVDARMAKVQPKLAKPVGLDEPVAAGPEAEMKISRISEIKGEANGIGEIGGIATRVEIKITNLGDTGLDLTRGQIRLYYGEDVIPATTLNDSRAQELPSRLEPRKTTEAIYIFAAPPMNTDDVLIEFETGSTEEVQLLIGEVNP